MTSELPHSTLERLPDELVIMIIEELSPDIETQSRAQYVRLTRFPTVLC